MPTRDVGNEKLRFSVLSAFLPKYGQSGIALFEQTLGISLQRLEAGPI
jgi:hypothetical protein